MANEKTCVEVRETENENIKIYSITWNVSEHPGEPKKFLKFENPEDSGLKFREIGQKGTALVCRIMAISGINEVFIGQNNLAVVKDRNFSWKKIEGAVLRAFLECSQQARGNVPFSVLIVGENMVFNYAP